MLTSAAATITIGSTTINVISRRSDGSRAAGARGAPGAGAAKGSALDPLAGVDCTESARTATATGIIISPRARRSTMELTTRARGTVRYSTHLLTRLGPLRLLGGDFPWEGELA